MNIKGLNIVMTRHFFERVEERDIDVKRIKMLLEKNILKDGENLLVEENYKNPLTVVVAKDGEKVALITAYFRGVTM